MSDTLTNALRDSAHSSSVLEGIANPAQLNPLAGIGTAMDMVQKVQGLDKNQAIKAWGEVLQQATDPKTGVVDYPRARALAAGRPDASYGMQEGLKDAQSLQTAGYNLTHAQVSNAHKSMAQLLADFPNGVPQSEVNRVLDNQVAQGVPQHVVDAARTTFGADKVQNTRTILQGLHGNMDAQTALASGRPPMGHVDTGQGMQPYQGQPAGSSAPPTAAVTPSGDPITTGLPSWPSLLGSVGQPATPEQAAALGVAPGTMIDVPLLQRYHQQGLDRVVPGIGGQGGRGGAGQGGGQRGATPAGAPAPGSVFPPQTPGVQPGRNTPPENSPLRRNPATGGGGATPPPPPVQDAGLKPIVIGAPPGTEEDVKAWQSANAALPDQKRNITAGEAALEALQHAHAGPGTAASAKAKAFMIAQGIPGSGFIDSNDVMQRQIAQKNLLRFAQGNGGKVGTDLGLTTQLDSNANVDTMLNSTVDHILKRDLGMARQRMVMALAAPERGTGKTEFGTGMGEHTRNFTPQTDPMAFAWDKLSPGERQAHLEQVKKVEGGEKKWERSMELARKYGAFQVPTAPAPAPAATAPAPAPAAPATVAPPAPTVVVRPNVRANPNALHPTTGY